jgi:hypothetical protein
MATVRVAAMEGVLVDGYGEGGSNGRGFSW